MFCSCVSEIITDENEQCEGNAKNTRGICRMDIVDSEIGYLGYYGSEAYGLTWKVRGGGGVHDRFDRSPSFRQAFTSLSGKHLYVVTSLGGNV